MRSAGKAFRQQLQKRRDGGHRRATGERVDVAQLVAVPCVGCFVTLQLCERFAATRIRVRKNRRRSGGMGVPHRHHVVPKAREAHAFRTRRRLRRNVVILGKSCVKKSHRRNVQPVKPHHRLRHAFNAVIAVIMPVPRRRNDEVSGMHRGALAADRRVRTLAIDDEAQRRLHVAMRRRDLAGQDQLQTRVQRLGDRRVAA